MAILLILALVSICTGIWLRNVGRREKGLPPGPPVLPLLGNLHMLPKAFMHYKLTEWAATYGGIYSLKFGPGTVIVLTDVAAVKELMEKRSANTASRPPIHIADLVTGGYHFALAQYTETWKTLRKTALTILSPQACSRHLPIQCAEATQLVYDILRSPQFFYTHIERYSSSVIFSVLYGKRAPRYDTPETTAFFHLMREWGDLLSPGATPPVDIIPILKYIPERWAKWKQDCTRVRSLQRTLYFRLLDETKQRLCGGDENGSFMEEVLAKEKELGMNWEMTAYLGGTLIEGAADTTAAYAHSLILDLVAYPDAKRKAYEEIDRIVGEDRMPVLEDLEDMPFIRAMILEVHRFRPIGPLMVPHATLAPEEYRGFIIPKGATIFVNLWGIFHDPALYENPEEFTPERYMLTENGAKPGIDVSDLRPNLAFGVGRRSCPGIHLAQNSINLLTLYLLWAFDFDTDIDKLGNPVKPDTFAFKQGLGTGPLPFQCRIAPRTTEKAEIIKREYLDAGDTFRKFEFGLGPEDAEFLAQSRAECL